MQGEPSLNATSTSAAIKKRERSSRLTGSDEFLPWVEAHSLEGTHLFWLPVDVFPMPHDQRSWLLAFLARWSQRMESDLDLRGELFFQYKAIDYQLANEFNRYVLRCPPLLGLSRRPGASLPTFPDPEEMKRVLSNGEPFDSKNWVADFCYWFTYKQPEEQRRLFAGLGGMTTLFLPKDPNTKAPRLPFTPKFRQAFPALQRVDADAWWGSTYAMKDAFLAQSKAIFGAGLENEPMYEGVVYILPVLESGHFFAASAQERTRWVSLFDVYVQESVKDQGVLLAFQNDLRPLLLDVLQALASEGLSYPVVNR